MRNVNDFDPEWTDDLKSRYLFGRHDAATGSAPSPVRGLQDDAARAYLDGYLDEMNRGVRPFTYGGGKSK